MSQRPISPPPLVAWGEAGEYPKLEPRSAALATGVRR
jgi:hypothetical protein